MEVIGKVALVTGSATGVGRATALDLASRGCDVVINYSRSEEEALQTVADVRALGARALLWQCDVSQDEQVQSMVAHTIEELGRLDILVNNAGTTYFVPNANLEGLTEDMWDHILAVNLKGTFFCSRAAAPFMRQSSQGAIVNVASVAGIRGGGSSIAYAASKAGVISLTTSLARVLAPEIRVNCVAPGFIDTRWLRRGMGERYEAARDRAAENNPLRRVSTPEDIAQVIVGLIAGADHVTGQTLVVDGGAGLG